MKKNTAKTFEDLIVWQKAHDFVLTSYLFSLLNTEFSILDSSVNQERNNIKIKK